MSDESYEMPETPWWSQPGTTAVLPETPAEAPPAPPPVTPGHTSTGAPRRKTSAVLLALALLVGGAAGGGVATLVDNNKSSGTSTVLSGTTPLVSGATTSSGTAASGTVESAAAIISPSIVTIEVTGQDTSSGFGGSQAVSDTGSGVIIKTSGYIVTNNHVVSAAANGGSVHVTLADGTTVPATIVGTDSSSDLAVLKINGQTGLKAATFATSTDLKVGQAVIAVGAPLGLSNTVTEGIISTLHRAVRTGEDTTAQAVTDAIQTDAAINPGNSGGGLVNLAGAVVGITNSIASLGSSSDSSTQSGNIGVGFAIPSETVTKVAAQLIASGTAVHAQIGVTAGDATSTTDGAPGLGATIQTVTAGFPAAKAGLQAGDIVTKINDRRVTDADTLIAAIRSYDPGDKVTLTYTRSAATKTVSVTLGSSADK